MGLRDEPVRGGEVRRDDRRAGGPALRERARDRLLDRRAHRSGSPRTCDDLLAIDVAEAALDRARAARTPRSRFERREIPEEFPDGAYDLIVVSEVLYYLDEPAFDATLNAIERTLLPAASCSPSTGARAPQRYPLTGDEVHDAARRSASARPPTRAETDKYNLDRFDVCGS